MSLIEATPLLEKHLHCVFGSFPSLVGFVQNLDSIHLQVTLVTLASTLSNFSHAFSLIASSAHFIVLSPSL
jgi:hypothetical protein